MGFFGFLKKKEASLPPLQPPPNASMKGFGDIPPPPERSRGALAANASDDEFSLDLGPLESPPDDSFTPSFEEVSAPGAASDATFSPALEVPRPATRSPAPVSSAPPPSEPVSPSQVPDDLPDFTADQIAAAEQAAPASKRLPAFDEIAPLPSLEVSGDEYFIGAVEYGLALKTVKALKGVARRGDKTAGSLGSLVSKHQERYAKFAESLNGIQERLMLVDDMLMQR